MRRNPSLEPLFAGSAPLWRRVWLGTQAAALVIGLWVSVAGAGGIEGFLASPSALRVLAVFTLVVLYHVAGALGREWILARSWALLLFVPLGWGLAIWALQVNSGFAVLLLGAILQGFIFLPFSWAVTTLALITFGVAGLVASRDNWSTPAPALQRVGGIVATGVMIGTVMLYIHRANREAVVRTRMLRQLDDAQHDLADRAREAGVHEERQRFARDIHDTLAQGFASVIKHLEAVELSLQARPSNGDETLKAALPHLAHAQAVSRTSLEEIRRLVWALQPAELSKAPLTDALARVVAQWGEANTIAATFTSDLLPALQPDADVIFLRATQEALSNVARHARATHVNVSLTCAEGMVLLTVEDDGCGFAPDEPQSAEHRGLSGMRERVRRFGGQLMIESAAGSGTSITVALPLSSIAAAEPRL
jgi:signal transduction histidine kinase